MLAAARVLSAANGWLMAGRINRRSGDQEETNGFSPDLLTSCFLLGDKWLSPERSGSPLIRYTATPVARIATGNWKLATGN
jgi:hypothetical protein